MERLLFISYLGGPFLKPLILFTTQFFMQFYLLLIIYLLVKDTKKLPEKVVTSNHNKVRSTLGSVESTLWVASRHSHPR